MGTLPVGAIVDHYRIEGFIGAGSMGDVYRGVDTKLGRDVAIKILSERHRDNEELRQRFEREARAVAATTHANVVQVFTTGHYDGKPYLAMEFLDGVDLGSSVDRVGPWPSLPTAKAILDAARGLEAAANAGLIHRDVKPANLVRLTDGSVKITDFGLAKPLDPGDEPALTAMGVVVGTPDYIAPEQARGDPIDARVDIYALGGTTYFMLVGTPPFRTGIASEDKYLKVVARHLRNPAPDARAKIKAVDPELAQLAVDMMAKKAEDRPSFPRVIEKLQRIVARLEASGSLDAIPAALHAGASGASPTPHVGQRAVSEPVAQPPSNDSSDSDSALTMIRRPSHPPTGAPSGGHSLGSSSLGSESLGFRRPKTSRLLVSATVASALLFAVGLGLLLFGPMPKNTHADTAASIDAGPAKVVNDAAPAPLGPPAGMMLIERADGTAWFYISRAPVTAAEYAQLVPPEKPLSPRIADKPVVKVSYSAAFSYAQKLGGRLPTAAEWRAAVLADGYQFGGRKMWEWVATEAAKRKASVRSGPKKKGTRKTSGGKDITFRVVKDL